MMKLGRRNGLWRILTSSRPYEKHDLEEKEFGAENFEDAEEDAQEDEGVEAEALK